MLAVVADNRFCAVRVFISHETVAAVCFDLLGFEREQNVDDFSELLEVRPEFIFLSDRG